MMHMMPFMDFKKYSGPVFVNKVYVSNFYHVKNIGIVFPDDKLKHIIITGPNGSGKTMLLKQMFGICAEQPHHSIIERNLRVMPPAPLGDDNKSGQHMPHVFHGGFELGFNLGGLFNFNDKGSKLFLASFSDNRVSQVQEVGGPRKINEEQVYRTDQKQSSFGANNQASSMFHQYLVNLEFERVHALAENDSVAAAGLGGKLEFMLDCIRRILMEPELKINFNRSTYNYSFVIPGRPPFEFKHLSAGMSGALGILSEILIAAKVRGVDPSKLRGIVFVDEIENHLHIELQRSILPMLTTVFPLLQFIVSTHSPFVVSSLENSVVYDLKNQEKVEDMTRWSIASIVRSYYDVNLLSQSFSQQLKDLNSRAKASNLSKHEKMNIMNEIEVILGELDSDACKADKSVVDLLEFLKKKVS